MSHISGESVQALMRLTECKAPDDAVICIAFDDHAKTAVPILDKKGKPLRLGELRELAAAFNMWLV